MGGLVATLSGLASVDITMFAKQVANFTLQNVTTVQPVFNVSTNGAITLLPNTSYFVEGIYLITNTGITSHTWSTVFGGTATFSTGTQYTISSLSATAAAPAAGALQGFTSTPGTAVVATAASTSATENVSIFIEGVFCTNAGGTLIPQVQLSAAPGGVQTTLAGSFLRIWPIGSAGITINGPWS